MLRKETAILLTGAMICLSGCGAASKSTESVSESTSAAVSDTEETTAEVETTQTEASEEETTADVSEEVLAAAGTYIGQYGSCLTLHEDGSADYYYPGYNDDEVAADNTWSVTDRATTVDLNVMDVTITADRAEGSKPYNFTGSNEYWDDEQFVRADTAAEGSLTPEEYLALRQESIPLYSAGKEEADEFDTTGLQEVDFGNAIFNIPTSYEDQDIDGTGTGNHMVFYNPDGVVLNLFYIEDAESIDTFVDDPIFNAVDQDDAAYWLAGYEETSIEGMDTWVYRATTSITDDDGNDVYYDLLQVYIYDEADGTMYFLDAYTHQDASYSYDSDLMKIAENIYITDTAAEESSSEESTSESTSASTAGADLASAVEAANAYGLSEVFEDEAYEDGTYQKEMATEDDLVELSILYDSDETILGARILIYSEDGFACMEALAPLLCPASSSEEVSAFVSENLGSEASTEIDGIGYSLSQGAATGIWIFSSNTDYY